MIENIVRHIPQPIRVNEISRRFYWAFTNYKEYLTPVINGYLFYLRYGHKLRKFKDIHKGQRCFIMGNGPSILQQDLTRLKNEELILIFFWRMSSEKRGYTVPYRTAQPNPTRSWFARKKLPSFETIERSSLELRSSFQRYSINPNVQIDVVIRNTRK